MPTLYWCSTNSDPSSYSLIRTHGSPMALANTLRAAKFTEPLRFWCVMLFSSTCMKATPKAVSVSCC
ncbi:MAG: hypothetical protein ACRD3Y_11270 [Bryobacteraceae bacterium]